MFVPQQSLPVLQLSLRVVPSERLPCCHVVPSNIGGWVWSKNPASVLSKSVEKPPLTSLITSSWYVKSERVEYSVWPTLYAGSQTYCAVSPFIVE